MIKFTDVSIDQIEDYDKVKNSIPSFLWDSNVSTHLKKYMGLKCDRIIIEYPYYDKDYLSIYYEHYAQKFKRYEKKCCRLHFEKGDDYYGYITLRPTIEGTKIGKTYIDPKLLMEKPAYLILGKHIAHVNGQTLEIECFPWKRQQTDISVCAHTATWTVLRYFGNKYNNYADITIGDIVKKVQNDWGRETPSLGLNPVQVSDLFKNYGFSPLILGGDGARTRLLLDETIAYIESGLPIVGFFPSRKHAISMIGHGDIEYDILDNKEMIQQLLDERGNVISHSRLIKSIYVMDDRYFAYQEVPIGLPDSSSDVKYGMNELYYAVVPLYSRMQLIYSEVYNRMITWLQSKVMKWEKLNICRIYITSSNSLKRNAMKSATMPEQLKEVILQLSLPKFVWCIDLAGIENYKKRLTSGRIIIDTTSATWDSEPWIMRHDGERIEYKDYDANPEYIITLKTEIHPYKIYENNLTRINLRREEV